MVEGVGQTSKEKRIVLKIQRQPFTPNFRTMASISLPSLHSLSPKSRRIPSPKFRSLMPLVHCSDAVHCDNQDPIFHEFTKFAATEEKPMSTDCIPSFNGMRNVACGLLAACVVTAASPVVAANQRLPPLSTEPDRCERAFVGNTIGQANGVYDKPIDLRFCDYTNDKSNLKGKTLSAALMSGAKFDGADMSEVVMSKAYAVGASFKGVDFSNAVLDRVNFQKADLKGAVFKNAVLSGSTFNDAELQDAIFEDTIIGYIDLQKLCVNTTITEEGRTELGCR